MRIGDSNDRPGPGKEGPRVANDTTEKAGTDAAKAGVANKGGSAKQEGGVLVRLGDVAAAVSSATRRPAVPDSSRVAEILKRISSGEFQVDFERLADKMLDEETLRGKRGR